MRLPNGDRAELGTKIEDDILNYSHPEGRHKARLFASILGITLSNAGILRRALLAAAATSDAAEPAVSAEFGWRYALPVFISTLRGSATVRSVWIVLQGEDLSASDNLLYHPRAMSHIRMHDVVALLEDVPATHFETGQPLTLRRGEVGTVVMTYDGSAVEVEFAAEDGCARCCRSLRASSGFCPTLQIPPSLRRQLALPALPLVRTEKAELP
jgi:hypothetical protein